MNVTITVITTTRGPSRPKCRVLRQLGQRGASTQPHRGTQRGQEDAGGKNTPLSGPGVGRAWLPGAVGSGVQVWWGGVVGRPLTSRKEQPAMSRMMQPRDQMSDFWLKEKLRASGAIQDL